MMAKVSNPFRNTTVGKKWSPKRFHAPNVNHTMYAPMITGQPIERSDGRRRASTITGTLAQTAQRTANDAPMRNSPTRTSVA